MAGSTWTYATGTSTNTSTVTTNATTSGSDYYGIKIYNPEPQITFKKAGKRRPAKARRRTPVKVVKDFWEGVGWEEYQTYIPRKSITGKIIVGNMHKRHKKVVIPGSTTRTGNVINTVLGRATSHTQYAKTKELFQEKLKGKA